MDRCVQKLGADGMKKKEEKSSEPRRKDYFVLVVVKGLVRLFYPRVTILGRKNIPEEPCIIVANHAKMNGPIMFEIYPPVKRYTWCIGEMMHLKEVPDYAFSDFWSGKPWWNRWFFRGLSYVIAPIAVGVFNNAETIGVYHDARLVNTFRETMQRLEEGADIVIFPEHDVPYNHVVSDFQEHFVDTARFYYRKTGKELLFLPAYVCPALKKLVIGKPTRFRSGQPIEEERERICRYTQQEITRLAEKLPLHTVVPYKNIPKKEYPKSRIESK